MQSTIRNRTVRVKSRATVPPSVSQERPLTYKSGWSEESMKMAYSAVMNHELSIREASARFCIPYTTLCDRVNGRVKFGSHSGPVCYLNDNEEEEIVTFLSSAASMGFARSKKEVLCVVEAILASKGTPRCISNGWWESFVKRHPQLCLRKAEKVSAARHSATDPVILDKYFDLLERTLEEYDLFDEPASIFNCDESGMCFEHKPPAVVAVRGQKHPRAITSNTKRQVTVMACANAAGYCIPPFLIFKRKTLPKSILEHEVPGTTYCLSDSGWMDSETFDHWFSNHFLIHAPPSRPLLLLLDGHSSHFNPQFITKAAHEKIIVFCLPPNTTHLLQPLDKGIFGPLKVYWNEECHRYLRTHPGEVISDYTFNYVFGRAWGRAMTIPNAVSAFRTTGVYPFDRSSVKAVDTVDHLRETTGLHYIPLLSPAPLRRKGNSIISDNSDACGISSNTRSTHYTLPDTPSTPNADTPLTPDDTRYSPDNTPYTPDDTPYTPTRENGFDNLLLNVVPQQSTISRFFPEHHQEIQPPKSYEKTNAKILTGKEYRKELQAKARAKEEKERLANEKKKERLARKAAKQSRTKTKPTVKGKFFSKYFSYCYSMLGLYRAPDAELCQLFLFIPVYI